LKLWRAQTTFIALGSANQKTHLFLCCCLFFQVVCAWHFHHAWFNEPNALSNRTIGRVIRLCYQTLTFLIISSLFSSGGVGMGIVTTLGSMNLTPSVIAQLGVSSAVGGGIGYVRSASIIFHLGFLFFFVFSVTHSWVFHPPSAAESAMYVVRVF
jgi:hypothetical protein